MCTGDVLGVCQYKHHESGKMLHIARMKFQMLKMNDERLNDPAQRPPASSCLRPTWRRPRLDGGRHVGGAALGWHWKSHLLLFMLGQGGLNGFCVDVCKMRTNANLSLVLGTQSRDAGSQRVKSSKSSGPPLSPCCQLQSWVRQVSIGLFILSLSYRAEEKDEPGVWYFVY